MGIIVDKLPKEYDISRVITIGEIVDLLPETIPFREDIWFKGNLVKSGVILSREVWFYTKDKLNLELIGFMNSITKPEDIHFRFTCRLVEPISKLLVYRDGKLVIDKKLLNRDKSSNYINKKALTINGFISKLPKNIPIPCTIWVTGGLVKWGITFHDLDFIIYEIKDYNQYYKDIKKLFSDIYNIKVEVGYYLFINREPIYLFKLYDKGNLLI
jgi:hypothetical protein